ncbi:non-structural maintenance of chromosomes element 1 homolog isoform X2 [Parus major]|uniref:non-structural maintenance of chromosomes element 1 homolog isoform X2 n=1 Tax=Parus major TaxID=9157 RepID=UPI001085327C|nr:non-structural maintenance of chromosomes element 1 homolog isoform X2 [Parus major]
MAAQMTDAHRRFLQVLMSNGITEGSEARKLHQHCCETDKVYYAHDKLDDFISTINSHLQPLFMQIRKGLSEDNGRAHYAVVNLAETEVTKMASDYTEIELELFRKTMDLIILSENGFASSTDILNLADQLKTRKMKKKEAEQVLKVFVEDKWLSEKNGEYTLHTRCIIEMEQYILSNYQDVARKCNICHSLAIQAFYLLSLEIKLPWNSVSKYKIGKVHSCNEEHVYAVWLSKPAY